MMAVTPTMSCAASAITNIRIYCKQPQQTIALSTDDDIHTAVLSPVHTNEISSFRQSRNKLNMFNLFRLCRKDEILQ